MTKKFLVLFGLAILVTIFGPKAIYSESILTTYSDPEAEIEIQGTQDLNINTFVEKDAQKVRSTKHNRSAYFIDKEKNLTSFAVYENSDQLPLKEWIDQYNPNNNGYEIKTIGTITGLFFYKNNMNDDATQFYFENKSKTLVNVVSSDSNEDLERLVNNTRFANKNLLRLKQQLSPKKANAAGIHSLPFYNQYPITCSLSCYSGHTGTDYGTPMGTPVAASSKGKAHAFYFEGPKNYGNVILITHGNGYKSLYAHLDSHAVTNGAQVQAGQTIGYSGNSGGWWCQNSSCTIKSSPPHLHFETRVNASSDHTKIDGTPVDPYGSNYQFLTDPPKLAIKQTSSTPTTFKAPALLTPKKDEMLDKADLVEFSWQDVRYSGSGDLQYRFHLFLPDQSSAIYSSAWNKNWTEFSKGFSTWSGTNHLRFTVQVKNNKNKILQSEVRHFYLNFPPKSPTNLIPTSNSTTDTTLILSWKDGGDQEDYPNPDREFRALLYKDGELFKTSVWRTDTKWVIEVDAGTYQWEVCADDGAWQTCSSKHTFKAQ